MHAIKRDYIATTGKLPSYLGPRYISQVSEAISSYVPFELPT